ncbi:putative Signal transduction histidine kinase fused with Metal dependent phosphohydrolase [Vibrio nigripulchritudo SOn1]|uniref:Signal transduction histidine kinase fused with Metal dependent phosphohydrolase n=1 Tax=Vibrio nigripulchritudo SOn1 TaxID=1238450 RepID=A0AAV2VUX9_9VIBR|nr:HD domain-containing phosphohydrolase [Vibrio nigripulchritudo]CCO48470.1 putative Signal transduction histidine kinase fused with Metal dependent phosphohydrolase [Vibrio nigripulchritudo SOn1]
MAIPNEITEEEIQYESLGDFFQDFREAHEKCEVILIDLEHRPDDVDLLNGLFRVVHTIKGNLVYVGLVSITPLMQSLEDLLDYIRKGHLSYDSILCDVILLSLDKTKQMVEARLDGRESPLASDVLDKICEDISLVADVSAKKQVKLINDVLLLLDPSAQITEVPDDGVISSESNESEQIRESYQEELLGMLTQHGIEIDDDIRFYSSMVQPLEDRSKYWHGRTLRQLFLSMEMNRVAGNPVDPSQLAVAVMLHDVGMSFMPLEMLNKKGTITSSEREILHHHPYSGYLLLNESIRWHDAAVMILQHHEQMDGSGYPNHLNQDQICDGAKILSIADTFDARTHERAHHTLLKRPLVRCIVEINNYKDKQFDARWVNVFNQVAKQHFKSDS